MHEPDEPGELDAPPQRLALPPGSTTPPTAGPIAAPPLAPIPEQPEGLGPPSPLRPIVQFQSGGLRWAAGLRAALGVGIPFVLVTGFLGITHGTLAAIGGYTVLYASREPYAYRARILAAVGVGLAAAAGAGSLAAAHIYYAAPVITLVAFAATFLTAALRVDRPGGYMFTLACALGTFLPFDPSAIPERCALVLAGAAGAWLVSMSGWILRPHHPENVAVADGFRAVAGFLDAIGTRPADSDRHAASQAVYQSWITVQRSSPREFRRPGEVRRLHVLAQRVLDLFQAGQLVAEERAGPLPPEIPAAVLALADAVGRPDLTPDVGGLLADADKHALRLLRTALRKAAETTGRPVLAKGERTPGRRPSGPALIRNALRPSSTVVPIAARTGLAVGAATFSTTLLPVLHPSWVAIGAAAALQGGNAYRDLSHALQRAAGTAVGATVVALFFHNLEPGAWATVLCVALLFGGGQTVVSRNLVIGTAFITPVSLLIASGGRPGVTVGDLASTRLVDMLIGLGLGVIGSYTLWAHASVRRLPAALGRAVRAEAQMLHVIVSGPVEEDLKWIRTRQATRRELLELWTVYDSSLGEITTHLSNPGRWWPAVVGVQRLGYRLMGAPLREGGPQSAPGPVPPEDAARLDAYLNELADAAENRRAPEPLELPDLWGYPVIRQHIKRLAVSLTEAAASPAGEAPHARESTRTPG